jgi:hypothetical protein
MPSCKRVGGSRTSLERSCSGYGLHAKHGIADYLQLDLMLPYFVRPAFGRQAMARFYSLLVQLACQSDTLLQGANSTRHCTPEALVQSKGHTLCGVGMAHMTAKPDELTIIDFPHHAVTVGTGENGSPSKAIHGLHAHARPLGNLDFNANVLGYRDGPILRFSDQSREERRHLIEGDYMLRDASFDGISRHIGKGGISRILHDADAAADLYGLKARRSVAKSACQHDTNRPRTAARRDRSEHGVYCRSGIVFSGTASQRQTIAFKKKMPVGRRNEDVARLYRESIGGERRREGTRIAQYVIEGRGKLAGKMNRYEDACWKVRRQALS